MHLSDAPIQTVEAVGKIRQFSGATFLEELLPASDRKPAAVVQQTSSHS